MAGMAHQVSVFFYGSYINPDVLAESGLRPDRFEVARLPGFDIVINPYANIVRDERAVVYGVLTSATHAELTQLYVGHAQDQLGVTYLHETVLVVDGAGHYRPTLVYISHDMTPGPVDPEYVERIARPAEEHGFPAWYVERIRSFTPAA